MKRHKNEKCKNCGELFLPDAQNRTRQKYCRKPECKKASKAASQKKWSEKPSNKDHFKGPINVQRVQEWRKKHPEYWKNKRPKAPEPPPTHPPLQDSSSGQPIEKTVDFLYFDAGGDTIALQDFINRQQFVTIGLISHFTGTALQEDIDHTLRRMQQSGKDILFHHTLNSGRKNDCKNPDCARPDTPYSQKFQLDRSPTGPGSASG